MLKILSVSAVALGMALGTMGAASAQSSTTTTTETKNPSLGQATESKTKRTMDRDGKQVEKSQTKERGVGGTNTRSSTTVTDPMGGQSSTTTTNSTGR